MATPEEFAELRNAVSGLCDELEIMKVSMAAAQESREADVAAVQGLPTREELNDHMNLIDKKVDEDNQVSGPGQEAPRTACRPASGTGPLEGIDYIVSCRFLPPNLRGFWGGWAEDAPHPTQGF